MYTHDLAVLIVPVSILFVTGYLLAPIMGRKVENSKSASFIMTYFCLATFTLAWIVILSLLVGITSSHIIFSALFIFIYGSFPIIISAALFIRSCKTVSDSSE